MPKDASKQHSEIRCTYISSRLKYDKSPLLRIGRFQGNARAAKQYTGNQTFGRIVKSCTSTLLAETAAITNSSSSISLYAGARKANRHLCRQMLSLE